jgi:hypothetical protein
VAPGHALELAQQEIVEALTGTVGVDLAVLDARPPWGRRAVFLRWIQGNTN